MKILIFNTLYYPNQIGGAEKSVQLLAEALLEAGEEPIVVCTADSDSIDYVNGIKVYYIKTMNLYWSYIAKEENKLKKPLWHLIDSYNPFNEKIEKIIREENPDIIHTNNLAGFSVSVWKLAKARDIKVVHTLRDYYLLCPKSTMFNEKLNKTCKKQCLTCKFYSIPKKKMSKYVDVVVGISRFILNKHIAYGYFKNAKQEIIYNSISIPNSVIEKTIKNEKDVIFGYVGSLSQSKGIEFLLEMFYKLDIDHAKLHVYGKGVTEQYEDDLRKKYQNKKIIFKGFQTPEKIYKNIDILIVPSLWNEPFGRIVPEANSYKVPVLVNNQGGLPELIKNGENGYVFDFGKKGDFEKKVNSIVQMYHKNNLRFHINKFSPDNIVGQYLEIYEKL